jgi:hypothetical protein
MAPVWRVNPDSQEKSKTRHCHVCEREASRMIHESGTLFGIKIMGIKRALSAILANRIGSRSRLAGGLRKAFNERSPREESAKTPLS